MIISKARWRLLAWIAGLVGGLAILGCAVAALAWGAPWAGLWGGALAGGLMASALAYLWIRAGGM